MKVRGEGNRCNSAGSDRNTSYSQNSNHYYNTRSAVRQARAVRAKQGCKRAPMKHKRCKNPMQTKSKMDASAKEIIKDLLKEISVLEKKRKTYEALYNEKIEELRSMSKRVLPASPSKDSRSADSYSELK